MSKVTLNFLNVGTNAKNNFGFGCAQGFPSFSIVADLWKAGLSVNHTFANDENILIKEVKVNVVD